jgi:3-oxoacyl-[acyl-carrier protein] reductase/pteridine reductase
VRSEPSVRAAVAQTVAAFGRLDILVNNAAVFTSAALESLTLDQWNTVFETNTRGPFLVAREALPHLRSARGRIINMGSLGGLHAWVGHAHYCASKAAVHMLTQAMAKAFAPDVSVNCVAPGWIEISESAPTEVFTTTPVPHPSRSETERWVRSREPSPSASLPTDAARRAELQSARFAAKTPMGRNGNANDVAQAVLFFATSPDFITGQILTVDGGLGLN